MNSTRSTLFICLLSLAIASPVFGQAWRTPVGWEALNDELGNALANGSGVDVSQVEAIQTSSGGYLPDPNFIGFLNPDKQFTDLSGVNDIHSSHARTVGRYFYGNIMSMASGVTNVYNYEAGDFIVNATGNGSNGEPATQPFTVQNHSWVATTGIGIQTAQNMLLRLDYMIEENNMDVIVGTSNSGATPILLAPGFNSITVGKTNGTHGTGLTTFSIPGRIKPEIVGPHTQTSRSTPMVSGAAAILRDAGAGTNADNSEAVKALILAGATKTEFAGWSRTSDLPLDTTFGAGELNVYNSYKMLLAGETDGQSSPPAVPTGAQGWDFGTIMAGQTMNYSIELTEPADHLSIVLTWNLDVEDTNASPTIFIPSPTLPDLDLFFVGNGLSDISNSLIQNIEHIYVQDVPAGVYSFIVSTDRTADFGLAWRSALQNVSNINNLTLVSGVNSSGNIAGVFNSDDAYYEVLPEAKVANSTIGSVVEFETTSPVNMPNAIQFNLESSVNTPNVEQVIELFNFNEAEYVVVDTSAGSLTDSTVNANVNGELIDFVDPTTGTIRARVTWQPIGLVLQYPWTVRIDQATFTVSQ